MHLRGMILRLYQTIGKLPQRMGLFTLVGYRPRIIPLHAIDLWWSLVRMAGGQSRGRCHPIDSVLEPTERKNPGALRLAPESTRAQAKYIAVYRLGVFDQNLSGMSARLGLSCACGLMEKRVFVCRALRYFHD
jgi:hypothetical protein